MRKTLVLLSYLLLLAPLASAQEAPPGPAPQMAKFEPMLGTWQGQGVMRMSPGEPPADWTGVQTMTRILDGHFVQEDIKVEMAGFEPMVFRTIMGWEPVKKSVFFFSVGSLGGVSHGTTYWAGDGIAVNSRTIEEAGQVVTDRSAVHYQGDTFTIRIDRAVGDGPFFRHVEGKFKRGGEPFTAVAAGFHPSIEATAPQLRPLAKLVGRYRVAGEMTPAPGAESISVTGRQDIRFIFDGNVLLHELVGDANSAFPGTYRGHYYQGWDEQSQRIVGLWITNMGELSIDETHVMPDGKVVSLFTGMYLGEPMAQRGVTTPDGEGGLRMTGWTMIGAGEPEATFRGHMTPRAEMPTRQER